MTTKIVIFDKDGVIFNSLANITYAMSAAVNRVFGLSVKEEWIASLIGKSSFEIWKIIFQQRYCRDLSQYDLKKLKQEYISVYRERIHMLKFFPGFLDFYAYLKDDLKLTTALCTTTESDLVGAILRHFNISFNMVVTGDDVKKKKPSPEGINKILKAFALPPAAAIFLGDTETDWLTGRAADVTTYIHKSGFGQEDFLAGINPRYLYSDFKELYRLFIKP